MTAEGEKHFAEAVKVECASHDEIQQSKSLVQEEKPNDLQEENKKRHAMKRCGEKSQKNEESCEIPLPVGCKITLKNEEDITLNTNKILELLASKDPYVCFSVLFIYSYEDREKFVFPYQLQQNVGVCGLKEILENSCKLLREGHSNSPRLVAYLFVLSSCCTTSAAVRKVLSFPGIVPLVKDFINTYMVAFIGTPFLKDDKLFHLGRSLASVLTMIGKFMAFSRPSQSDDLLTWWKDIDELYKGRASAVTSNHKVHKGENNAIDALKVVSAVLIGVSETMERMQATDPPQPYEIVKGLNHRRYYAVFCSSLQCPVFAEEDGVLFYCARCKLASYCSRQCQRVHWKQGHKRKCWKTTWDVNLRLKSIRAWWMRASEFIIGVDGELPE